MLITGIETAIALVLVLGVLVLFHEAGHFITARLTGMRVDEFAFGFGKRLITLFKRGDTEFTIHLWPLGGFCKIAGMEPGEVDVSDGFQAQAIWKRALVVFAGPLASFLLAALIFVTIGIFWGFQLGPEVLNRVAQVDPGTVAHRIGLRAGDWVREIDGKKITTGNQAVDLIHNSPGKQVTLTVERNGQILQKTATPAWMVEYLGAMWSFQKPHQAVAEAVYEKSAAARAGIKAEDVLISINGKKISSGQDLVREATASDTKTVTIAFKHKDEPPVTASAKPEVSWIQYMSEKWLFPGAVASQNTPSFKMGDQIVSIKGKKVTSGEQMLAAISSAAPGQYDVTYTRDEEPKPIHVTSQAGAQGVTSGVFTARGLLGFVPQPVLVKKGFVDSIKIGMQEVLGLILLLANALQPSRISDNIGGPLMIFSQTRSMVALGPYFVVKMAGILSLSLAFINLIPIPVVDGGHLAFLGIEAIRRKRFTNEQMQIATAVGMVILAVLFFAIFSHDLLKITQGRVPQ